MGPGWDANNPDEVALWNQARARDHEEGDAVDALGGSGQDAGDLKGHSAEGPGAAEVEGESPAAVAESGHDSDDEMGADTSSSQAAHPAEADPHPAETSDAREAQETTPPQQRWAPVPQNSPATPLQARGEQSSSPTPANALRAVLDTSGTSHETPSPESHHSTPPAPGAGDGPRYARTEGTSTPGGPGNRALTSVPSADSAPPADEAAEEAVSAESPDFPRASIEREAGGGGESGEGPGADEDLHEEVQVTEQVVEDAEATNRRKRSDAPDLSSPEDDVDSVNGEPASKRRKDDKDDDCYDDSASTAANRPIPQLDGAGYADNEKDSPRTAMGKATNAINTIDGKKEERLESGDQISGLFKQTSPYNKKQVPVSCILSKGPTGRKNQVKLDPAKDMPYMRTSKDLCYPDTVLKPSESRLDQQGEGKGTWKEMMQEYESMWDEEEEEPKDGGSDAAEH